MNGRLFFGRGTREGGRQGKNFLEEMTPVARGKVTAVVEEEGIGGSHELVPIMHIRTHREKIPPPVPYMPPGKCLNALLLRLLLSRTTPPERNYTAAACEREKRRRHENSSEQEGGSKKNPRAKRLNWNKGKGLTYWCFQCAKFERCPTCKFRREPKLTVRPNFLTECFSADSPLSAAAATAAAASALAMAAATAAMDLPPAQ